MINDVKNLNTNKDVINSFNHLSPVKTFKRQQSVRERTNTIKGQLHHLKLSTLLFKSICKCNSKNSISNVYALYEKEKESINNIFDSVHYLKMNTEFQNMKLLLLNDEQNMLLSILSSEIKSDVYSFREALNNIVKVKTIHISNSKEENTRKLLDLMDDKTKNFVMKMMNEKKK